MDEQLKSRLLDSTVAGRLVTFTGAGLSMAHPSEVPSAFVLAQRCAAAYESNFGEILSDDCHTDIEKLAEYFAGRMQLESVFLGKVIEQAGLGPFMRQPNKGHTALADMLGSSAIEANISTNVDCLIEVAAEALGEPVARIAVTREEAVTGTQPHKPHVKLHGCFRRNQQETLWCSEQLDRPPFETRIQGFTELLPNLLLGKDLIFLGFWTDWAYLNKVFEAIITHAAPRLIVLVNLSNFDSLRQKAPILSSFSTRPNTEFIHVQESAADFLDELRCGVSERFMKVLLNRGITACQSIGKMTPAAIQFFNGIDSDSLYRWRRDSTGTAPDGIVREKNPDARMAQLGTAHLELQEMGAVIENDAYRFRGRRVRLVHGAGQYLVDIEKAFTRSSPLLANEDIIVCVGAKDTSLLPLDITKGANRVNIVNRGDSGYFLTDASMQSFLSSLPNDTGVAPQAGR